MGRGCGSKGSGRSSEVVATGTVSKVVAREESVGDDLPPGSAARRSVGAAGSPGRHSQEGESDETGDSKAARSVSGAAAFPGVWQQPQPG